MRILVCGGRDFKDHLFLEQFMSDLISENVAQGDPVTIIHGMARGADHLAGNWAKHNGLTVEEYPALWAKDGKAAGPIRNARMLAEGKPDIVVAFPGGSGTAHMVRISQKAGVRVIRATADGNGGA